MVWQQFANRNMEGIMEQKPKEQSKQNSAGNQQRSYSEGGRQVGDQGGGTHGGQHSGSMGGNDSARDGSSPAENRQGQPQGDPGNRQDDLIGTGEAADMQQSAQREGMGHHRHSGRANEQDLDTPRDEGDLGSHSRAAGRSGS